MWFAATAKRWEWGRKETEDRSREGEKQHRRGKVKTRGTLSESNKQGQKN